MEIEDFVDNMDFDDVIRWGNLLDLDTTLPYLDDDWPDWESEMKDKIVEELEKIGVDPTDGITYEQVRRMLEQ